MKFKSFEIENYKAIEKLRIDLIENLIPIIGINESGKTSVLNAILAFDESNDRYNSSKHIKKMNNIYNKNISLTPIITASLSFNEEDLKLIGKDIEDLMQAKKWTPNSNGYKILKDIIDSTGEIKVSRNLDTKKYSFKNLELKENEEKAVLKSIIKNMPAILYFDDFNERIPEKIEFLVEDIENDYIHNSNEIWLQYINQIMLDASENEMDIKKFISTEKSQQRDNLSDINENLKENIMKSWNSLRSFKKIDSELQALDNLDFVLNFEKIEKMTTTTVASIETVKDLSTYTFEFLIKDKSTTREREFSIGDRSKGFQWFFNFVIKLRYNHRYSATYSDAIFLLDEPGSYLHTNAQMELLSLLKELSQRNQIIFCTHSEHLLTPKIIPIKNIRIASKLADKIELNRIDNLEDNYNRGAFTPILNALHLDQLPEIYFKKKTIITEGITEFYFFKLLQKYSKLLSPDIIIIPGKGASNLEDLIAMNISLAEKYILILDNDEAGRNALNKYRNIFGEREADKWITVISKKHKDKMDLEKLYNDSSKEIMNKVIGKNLKDKIGNLYYGDDEIKKEFIQEVINGEDLLLNIEKIKSILEI